LQLGDYSWGISNTARVITRKPSTKRTNQEEKREVGAMSSTSEDRGGKKKRVEPITSKETKNYRAFGEKKKPKDRLILRSKVFLPGRRN